MFIIVACCSNAIMHTKAFAVLGIVAFTFAVLLLAFQTSESYAQNNTITGSNQSGSNTTNDTAAWSNQSDSGSISALARGF
jgi:hypothetical protein